MLSNTDINSLNNLSRITTNSYIDVDEQGTVGVPYSSGAAASIWRTTRFYIGYKNGENIFKIEALFKRALYALHSGEGGVDLKIEQAIEGFSRLKETYNKKETIRGEITRVVDRVRGQLLQWREQPPKSGQIPENLKRRRELETSQFFSPAGTQGNEGFSWLDEKIEIFLKMEADLSQEEHEILRKIQTEIKEVDYWENLRKGSPIFDHLTCGEILELKRKYPENLLQKLERFSDADKKNLGIMIPTSFLFKTELEIDGHSAILTLSLEEDGSYTLASINAGLENPGAITKVVFHLLQPTAEYGQTVVEWGPLLREEGLKVITSAFNRPIRYETQDKATKDYTGLFAPFLTRKRAREIPSRRQQVSPNCGTKTPTEWFIFCLQRYGKVDLANRFLQFSPLRNLWTSPPIDLVEPLHS